MQYNPASATPYEVLGVSSTATQEEVRRAYRRRARETHPDLGGSAEAFRAVQDAWARIGSAEDRARYSSGGGSGAEGEPTSWAAGAGASGTRADSRPKARAYGHPGGRQRERYLILLREWAGRGVDLPDPYDPALVRSAPREIRRILADALSEEETARTVTALGMGYTIWSDVACPGEEKLDHLVLGPSGLYAVRSEDWGSPISVVRGELVGGGIAEGEEPVRTITRSARAFAKLSRVPFTALLIVVPDEDLSEPITPVRSRRSDAFVLRRSALTRVLREGVGDSARRSLGDVYEVRAAIQAAVTFV